MKKLTITLLVTMSVTLFSYSQKTEKQTITIATNIYCNHCLQCGSCAININSQIRNLNKGISKIVVKPEDNTITVTFNSEKTNPDKIRAAINAAGYDADEQKATAEAVSRLDACCRKK